MASADSKVDVKPEIKVAPAEPQLTITIRDQTDNATQFRVKKTTRMGKIFAVYAERRGIQAASIKFLFDGARVGDDATPELLGLEDNDQIDCMVEQIGGRQC